MSSAKEGRLAALRKQNWINMPSGPRDGTQRPRLMIELRAMPETRGNVTTENKRGERVTNEGKGNESLFSPCALTILPPRFHDSSSSAPLNNPIFHCSRSPLRRGFSMLVRSILRLEFPQVAQYVRGEKKKKKKRRNKRGRGRIVNECGSRNEKGSSSSVVDWNLVSSSFLCARVLDLIVEIWERCLRDYNATPYLSLVCFVRFVTGMYVDRFFFKGS